MEFNKQQISNILFASTYVAMLTQIIGVYFTFDIEENSYLSYLKFFFWISSILAIWSHHKSSITDPGRVTHEINSIVLEYYINLHDIPIKRAEKFNQSYGRMLFDKMDDEDKKEAEDEESDESDEDEFQYEQITTISDQVMERISKDYKIELKRCNSCFVVKTPGMHHCSFCRGCVMKRNHHCPWINNCVGQFNQKFFIQFCWYCMWGCGLAGYMTCYYLIYKNKKE